MAGFFDSLGDYVSESVDSRMGERPGESNEQMIHRKLPTASYVDDLIGNIPQGIMDLGQGTYEAVTNPRQTAESLAGYVAHPADTASGIYQHYANRYRNLPTALETLRSDPVGVAGDVLPFAGLPSAARGTMSAANRAARAVERARGVSPMIAAREVGATPSGWDIDGTVRPSASPSGGDWDAIDRIRRSDRTRPWREPLFPEPRLNPEGASSPVEGGGGPSSPIPPAGPRRAPYATPESFWDRLADLPEQTQADIHSLRQGGPPLSRFRMNAVMSALNRRGLTMDDLLAADPMVTGMAEGSRYAPPSVPKRFFDKNTGIYPDRNNETMRKALAISAGAGLGAGAVNLMNRPDIPAPVVPVTEREERPVTAAPFMSVVDPKYFAATDFEPSMGRDRSNLVDAPMPPRRPAVNIERPAAPSRGAGAGRGATPTRRPSPKRTAPQRERDTGKRYYGDYRDTDPFASDPIGQFIDELTGQRKMARKPGRQAPSSGGLGDLLPFADGGTVRRPFADGGVEDRIPVLSDIGDALGGMMQGGEQPVVAADRGSVDKENIFERWSNNPLSQYLFAAGLGMMASPQANPLMAIGEGGLRGLEYMQAVQANADMRRKEREAAANRKEILERSREIQKGLLGEGDEQTAAPVPSKTAEAEPAAPSVVAPIKTAEAEPGQAVPPQAAPVSTPQEQVKPPVQAAPAPQPVIAADNQIKKINRAIQEFSSLREASSDSMTRNDLDFKIRQLESARNKIEKQQERAIQDARYQERLEEQRRQSSPEYKGKEAQQQAYGKKLVDLDTEIYEQASGAQGLIDQFETYKQALQRGIVPTGFMGETRNEAHKARLFATGKETDMQSRLADNIKEGAMTQTIQKLGGKVGGGVSDGDREAFKLMGISLNRDKQSNIDTIEAFQNAQRRNIEFANWVEKYKADHGGNLDSNFLSAAQKWRNSQPSVIPQSLKQDIESFKSKMDKKEEKLNASSSPGPKEKIPEQDKLEIGKVYTGANGKKGRWTGTGFVPVTE